MSAERLLVVTADDFGASLAVNDAIVAAHASGIVTSASLMITGEAADDAVAKARALPGLSTGLHLVLCDGFAASPPAEIPDLVDAAGRFPSSPARVGVRLWTGRARLRPQIEREVRAQLERYLATGLRLDHVDGHHHLHMHPVVFEIVARCVEELGVPWVRLVHEDAAGRARRLPLPGDEVVPAIFRALSARHRARLSRGGVARGPERLYGLRDTSRMDEAAWLRLAPRLRADVVEVFCHPRRDTEAGRNEERAARSARVRAAIASVGYRLAGTRAFAPAEARAAS